MKKFIFILGPPLSGKSTLCKFLGKNQQFQHLPLGEVIRNNEEFKVVINSYLSKGQLIPPEICLQILKEEMIVLEDDSLIYLLDGYPRSMGNLLLWYKHFSYEPLMVINLNINEDLLINRLKHRQEVENRVDDNINSLKNRIESFHNDTMDVMSYYKEKNLLYEVDADDLCINISQRIVKLLDL